MTETKELTITVPDSWSEVTLGQFQGMALIDPGLDAFDRLIQVVSILTDRDPAEVEELPMETFQKVSDALKWVDKMPSETFERSIRIDDDVFAIVPRLEELTVGEWIDLDHNSQDLMKTLHKFLAILYRPVSIQNKVRYEVEQYDSSLMQDRAELFREKMTIGQVYGAAVFFSLIGMGLLPSIRASLAANLASLQTMN